MSFARIEHFCRDRDRASPEEHTPGGTDHAIGLVVEVDNCYVRVVRFDGAEQPGNELGPVVREAIGPLTDENDYADAVVLELECHDQTLERVLPGSRSRVTCASRSQ
jgi:hypothetical protein